jgi:hypothetical protein
MSKQKGHKGPKPLPVLAFPGRLLVVSTVADLPAALLELRTSNGYAEGIGMDMEWDADMTAASNNPIALLQLASEDVCVIFRLIQMGNTIPDELLNLLVDDSIIKITHVRFRLSYLPSLIFICPQTEMRV